MVSREDVNRMINDAAEKSPYTVYKPKNKQYRFFYHYNKFTGGMTVHFRGECNITENVECRVPCETKYNKSQPRLVMRGFAHSIDIQKDKIIII